jgi:hypothetical protein
MNRLPLVLLFSLQTPASQAASRPSSQPQSRKDVLARLSEQGRSDFETLRTLQTFTDAAIGDGGDTPGWVHAFRRLLAEPDAAAAFRELLRAATLPGQLYALCGLWYADPGAFRLAVPRYARMTVEVPIQFGCTGGTMPVKDLVESHHALAVRLQSRDQTIREWIEKHDRESKGVRYDILGGAYPYVLKSDRW